MSCSVLFFFFQAEDGIRDIGVTGVQTCALPIFGILRVSRRTLQRRAPREGLPYISVGPSHSSSRALGTATYEGYLERYMSRVHPPLLCFDHYPLLSGGGITADYFYNWATIRNLSRKFGVPAWVFVQSVGFDSGDPRFLDRRRPNDAEIRWQVNVSLAYGAKGIQYFTYWTPDVPPDASMRFGEALVTLNGRTTPLYDYAKDRKSTRLNSSHANISYAVFCLQTNKTTSWSRRRKPPPLSPTCLPVPGPPPRSRSQSSSPGGHPSSSIKRWVSPPLLSNFASLP